MKLICWIVLSAAQEIPLKPHFKEEREEREEEEEELQDIQVIFELLIKSQRKIISKVE